jgi:hypothetical protein
MRGRPQPAGEVDAVRVLVAESGHCSLQERSPHGVAVRNHEREAVEKKIRRARARRSRYRSHGSRHLRDAHVGGHPPHEQRPGERIQVGITSKLGRQRRELGRGREQKRRSVAATPQRKRGLRTHDIDLSALELVERSFLGRPQ